MKRMSLLYIGLLVMPSIVIMPLGLSAQMTLAIGGGLMSGTYSGDSYAVPGRDTDVWFGHSALIGKATGSNKGFHFGASLGIPLAGRISLSTGGHYVQKGARIEGTGASAAMNVGYFEVPLLLSVRLTGTDGPIGFSVFSGPAVAFEASCTVEQTIAAVTTDKDCDEQRLSTDLSAIVGVSVRYPISESLDILVSGGVDYGLRQLDTRDGDNVKNKSKFASVRLSFPIGG